MFFTLATGMSVFLVKFMFFVGGDTDVHQFVHALCFRGLVHSY